MSRDLRQVSKENFSIESGSETTPYVAIQTSAIIRIADATELMAKNYAGLVAERDRYKSWYERELESGARMARRINALRGTITRMKKKILT